MTGLELKKALVASGTGVAKFAEFVDHLFVNGDCPADDVVKALEAAPRDLSATVAKAKAILADHAKVMESAVVFVPDVEPVPGEKPEWKAEVADRLMSPAELDLPGDKPVEPVVPPVEVVTESESPVTSD